VFRSIVRRTPSRAAPLTERPNGSTISSRNPKPNRDRPKEVKCPRVVTETYKAARPGVMPTRS
jgi:hypothetical protein